MAKLIIIRGPSGSGKSTVASALHRIDDFENIIIEQDYYKEIMFHPKGANADLRAQLMFGEAKLALENGISVIMEGILGVKYKPYFDGLFDVHPRDNHMFFLNVGFDETLRRHMTRAKANDFGEDEMRQWFDLAKPLPYDFETMIPETMNVGSSVALIRDTCRI
jgi:energy-coupling factor transporter ATP-binding protein EcfA2